MLYFHVKSIHGAVSAAIKYALLFSCGFKKEDEYHASLDDVRSHGKF